MYIHEAHPADGWQLDSNVQEDVVFDAPTTAEQRHEIAAACCERLSLTMPTVVDTMDDAVDTAYAAWPERMFVINRAGRIAYAGQRGPWGFKPNEVARWLFWNVGPPATVE